MKEPIGTPYRARCDGCRLMWDVGVPFPSEQHGQPHAGCRFGGRWQISESEMNRLIDAAKAALDADALDGGDRAARMLLGMPEKDDPPYQGGSPRKPSGGEPTPEEKR